jgi:hypothetical protein
LLKWTFDAIAIDALLIAAGGDQRLELATWTAETWTAENESGIRAADGVALYQRRFRREIGGMGP